MARNIKIELELPEFEKELVVSVTLKRDGEITSISSSPEGVRETTSTESGTAWKQGWGQSGLDGEAKAPKKTTKKSTGTSSGSNMMDMNF